MVGDKTVLQDFLLLEFTKLERIFWMGTDWPKLKRLFFEDPERIQAGKDQKALETGNSLEVPSRCVSGKPLFFQQM